MAYLGSGATTVTSTDANTVTISSTDTNTTYTQNASAVSGGANLNLVGSDSTTDSIKLAGGTNVTVTRTDADTVTIASTDTNTTYTQNISSTSGGANLNLVGSDATTDTVKFADGTGVTVSYTDANTATIAIGQSVGTGDSPSFAGGTFGNITVGVATDNTIASTDTNGNITLTPNGSGTVIVSSTLDVQGGTITESTGALSITTGAGNGAITLDPNGTGNVVLTFANGGNLTNDRNYVFGAIRNATTQSNGDIWVLDADSGGAGTLPVRGISLDNSTDFATKNAGVVVRNYSNTAAFAPRVVFERARYTSTPATPLTLSSGDTIGVIAGTGYTSTGWLNDTTPVSPAILTLSTSEAWVSNTNLGTAFTVLLAPSATTINTSANLISVISANPQTFACRSDAYTWSNGKTGTTQRMSLDVSGNLIVSAAITATTGNITATAGNIQTTAGKITANGAFDSGDVMTANVSLLDTNTNAGGVFGVTTKFKPSSGSATFTVPQSGWRFGSFRMNGSDDTAGTSFVLASQLSTKATENWVNGTNNGTAIELLANKKAVGWTTGHMAVASLSPEDSKIVGDIFTIENSAGTDYAVFNSTSATFAQPVGFPVKTVAQWGAITGVAGQQVCVSNSSTSPTQSDDGMMAYWGTSGTAGWKYIHDNRAI